MDMSQILREVGRGKRGSRDLNYTEALTVAENPETGGFPCPDGCVSYG